MHRRLTPARIHWCCLLIAIGMGPIPVRADLTLAQQKKCTACHAVDRRMVGPAYREVARRYAGQDASDALAHKIMQGGSGNWGKLPMPAANPRTLTVQDARTLARWILSLHGTPP